MWRMGFVGVTNGIGEIIIPILFATKCLPLDIFYLQRGHCTNAKPPH
jgi:hypothetical protein